MMNKEEMMMPFVMEQLENGLRKGYYEFDDKNMNLEKWLKLPLKDKMDSYKIRLTQKGKEEAPQKDLLKVLTSNDFTERYIKNIMEKDGEITIELTEEGIHAKKLGEIMGLNFDNVMINLLSDGLRKQFNRFIRIDKNKLLDGQMRR